jgi:hypothetical protein
MQEEAEVEGGISWIAIVAVVAIVVAAVAFFAGRALAGGGGPETLSEAVAQAQSGDLPCGDVPDAPTPAAGAAPPTGGVPGQGGPGGAGGAGFLVRAVCAQDGQNGQDAQGRMGGGGGFGGRGGFSTEVKSVDGTKLTLTGPQGDTTVEIGPETTVSKSTAGEAADIKAGDSVIVSGGRQGEAATSVLIVPGTGSN